MNALTFIAYSVGVFFKQNHGAYGNSEIDPHVQRSHLCYLICLRQLEIDLEHSRIRFFVFCETADFLCTCASCSELPSNSTMIPSIRQSHTRRSQTNAFLTMPFSKEFLTWKPELMVCSICQNCVESPLSFIICLANIFLIPIFVRKKCLCLQL